MATGSPIADLSYRNVSDAPLRKGGTWWVIAKNHIQRLSKIRSFWVLTVLASGNYLIMVAVIFFMENLTNGQGGDQFAQQFFERIVWKDQFLNGFQFGHFLLMAILLLVGAGSIANDNSSKALLVYFSKPCSKWDYLIGKFVGIFLLILMAMLIPALFFMFYGSMNFRDHGFLTDDPWMIPKVLLSFGLVAAYQASVILGVSSLFNQGRMAGATYAGVYVLTGVFSGMAKIIGQSQNVGGGIQKLLDKIHYLSLYGGSEGIFKVVLGTDGSSFFREGRNSAEAIVPRPEIWLLLLVTVVPVALCWFIAYKKVRAVEVVS
ncbi:MAG: ABC transporter permease [Fimbriimonadaceae bacterium]